MTDLYKTLIKQFGYILVFGEEWIKGSKMV